jgi:hypothetical protein
MATDFHLFLKHPVENRHQIWRHAIPLFPRVIEASLVPYSHIVGGAWIIRATHVPALLSANSESRAIARDWYAQIFKRDPWLPWTDQKSPSHLLINYSIDTLFINMPQTTMQDASVIGIFTQIFGYETTVELKQHLKSLAGTGHFWSKFMYPIEIPSELGEGPDNLEEVILVCKAEQTQERNTRLSNLRELARTRFGDLQGVQLTWFNEGVSAGEADHEPATEVLRHSQEWLYTLRRSWSMTWIPGTAKVCKCVVWESE